MIDLRELETRCIQDEPAFCTARCPIHIDVRAFLKEAALGAWDKALQVLAMTMPLPGIVARICDHPCEGACKREEAGGAIAVGGIERITATLGHITKRRTPLPQKKIRVAIVGSDLNSLTAAWDLAYKGYQVTLYETGHELGGSLRGISEDILPQMVMEEEIAFLQTIGVETSLSVSMNSEEWLGTVVAEFDAVYIGSSSLILPQEYLAADPFTLATSREGLFVSAAVGSFSPMEYVTEGRKAAVSLDRFLKKVSLVASREKEGPYETKLFTSLEHVTPQLQVPMEDPSGFNEAEAVNEAKRCIQCECMECVKVCPYLEHFESYPKRYVRQISTDATMVMGSHGQTSKLVNSCSLCGLCEVVCPQNISMADVCMEGRRSLAERHKMPPSAHAFALDDMAFSNSDKAAFALHEPGKDRSQYVFFPGCQLSALYPEHVLSTYDLLRKSMEEVGLMLSCCGVPAKWAARDDLFAEVLRSLREAWEGLGSPSIIAACPTCSQTLKEHLPQAKVVTLWEILADAPEALTKGLPNRLAIHDPCTTRHEPAIHEAVRKIVTHLGCTTEELVLGRENTECCGYGGLMSAANPLVARKVADTRASRSETDYVTYCAMCRNVLAATGKRAIHLIDLIFPTDQDPYTRAALGYSDRQENRHRLKETALRTLWGHETPMDTYENIKLYIADETSERMEERRILRSDVQKVIDHGEQTRTTLFNADTGRRLASFRPGLVTYWVEYSPEGSGFRVHRAYCHRMEIVEEKGP